MRPKSPPSTDTGFLSQDADGRLCFGAEAVRGWPWIFDSGGVFESGGPRSRSFAWKDLAGASLRVKPTIVFPLLFRPWRDFEYRVEMRTRDGKGWYLYQHHLVARSDRRVHARALPAVLQFLIATPDARAGLDDPGRIEAFLDELRRVLALSELHPRSKDRWPGAPLRHRRSLDVAAVDVLAELGVVLFGGRPARGTRVEADPDVVDAVLAVWTDEVGVPARAPAPEVVAAALDAAQGPRPDWPLDVLVPGDRS